MKKSIILGLLSVMFSLNASAAATALTGKCSPVGAVNGNEVCQKNGDWGPIIKKQKVR